MSSNDKNFPKLFNEKVLQDWFSTLDGFFQEPFQRFFDRQIPVDVYETLTELIVEADLPGVKREQIHLEWLEDGLKITVEDKKIVEEENNHEKYYRKERSFQRMERYIPLPYTAAVKEIKAKFQNGILEIKIPKKKRKRNDSKMIDIE
ncbi:Hsp20/alpha crystallin family protein [Bacillus taeanensis]|uniref:Hsp20/alpha crystallin family protein n=1 Tax=Bacillus taeanensis TaxID=273032 RepID=A0A366Y4T0_9BACI|nr:Hsp20/alpha crystallin family protein [Bacillus taeanensis]RBW71394.1 Hsp20/alpha crystallin family protein [Bacillus taeanensis]